MIHMQCLYVEITKFTKIEVQKDVLNRRQCKNLLDNFRKGVEAIQSINNGASYGHALQTMGEYMLRVVKKARILVEECCKDDWCQTVLMQMNNKEDFRELLLDFECCYHIMCEMFGRSLPSQEVEINKMKISMTFYPTSIDEVEEDQNSIYERLSKHLDLYISQDHCRDEAFVHYLMKRIKGLQKAAGAELNSIIFPHNYHGLDYGSVPFTLGDGAGGHVYATTWYGFESATKVIKVLESSDVNVFLKEACILGGLDHPNIIKFFCCGFKTQHHFGKDFKAFELVMERGERNLSDFLSKQYLLSKSESYKVDIMLQIARGMCYLHDMKVAHRDLKPQNVVIMILKDASESHHLREVHVKLVDFGISKIEVKNSPEVPTGEGICGTVGYMAPEAFENRSSKVDAFKTDVFSFGMICCEIISGHKHFDGVLLRDYIKSILKDERPNISEIICSEGLKSLIRECWSLIPSKRPTFLDICEKLMKLKCDAMLEAFHFDGVPKHFKTRISHIGSTMHPKKWSRRFKQLLHCGMNLGSNASLSSNQDNSITTFQNQMLFEVNNKTNTAAGFPKLVGLKEKITEMEELLQRIGSLGIVGMGGIGKSTLANALSAKISDQYDATCFVGEITDEKCTFLVQYKLEDVINSSSSIKTLKEGHKFVKQLLQKLQKILIVLDNVGKACQLNELLQDQTFQNVNGSKFIATSRNWESLKQYVPIDGKVNMWTLDGKQSMKLFCIRAFATNQPCLPYLKCVVGRIVGTCDGLPLSLEVTGSYLRGEKRLRVWERTWQRLVRARHDGSMDEKIWKTLRISFDELDDKEKRMFLDISCFFCKDAWVGGVQFAKDTILRMFDGDVNIIRQTLESLQDKSLLKVGEMGGLEMHDHLRDMGRMIVENNYQRTRFWDLSPEIFIEYCNQKGLEIVEGLSIPKFDRLSTSATIVQQNNMKDLRLLSVQNCENVDFLFAIISQTTKLKWLRIHFPTLDDEFSMQEDYFIHRFKNIVVDHLHQLSVLDIFNNKIWKNIPFETIHLIPLRELSFTDCETLEQFPTGLGKLVTLERLNIRRCKTFKTIPEGLGKLTCLKTLHMLGCEALEEFPTGVCTLNALEELWFQGCKSLKKISEGFGGLTCLTKLNMSDCQALEEFPTGVCTLNALEELKFHGCKSLKKISEGFGGLTYLTKLYMYDCQALEEFPTGVCTLNALEDLRFQRCKSLKKISEGFGGLTCLRKLYMYDCEALEEFPTGVRTLNALEDLRFQRCKPLKKISEGFGGLTCLTKLNMSDCQALEEFPTGVDTLNALEELRFDGCKSLKKISEGFGGLTCLTKLYMSDCQALEEFPTGVRTLNALEDLRFQRCKSLKKISEGFGGLTCLTKLYMYDCEALEEFPTGVGMLNALEELKFRGCKSLKKISEGFVGLTCLRKLYMYDCEALEEFPTGVCTLNALEDLRFQRCKSLKKISEGFGGLTCLTKLCMYDCEALEEFPTEEDFGRIWGFDMLEKIVHVRL